MLNAKPKFTFVTMWSFTTSMASLLRRKWNAAGDWVHRTFRYLMATVHHCSGRFVEPPPLTWNVLFASPNDDGLSVVTRIFSAFEYKRVQGKITLQKLASFGMYRLTIDGFEVVSDENDKPSQGPAFQAALFLPCSSWKVTPKKVKSFNTTSVRGKSYSITFGANSFGLTSLQITFLHENEVARDTVGVFEDVLKEASSNVTPTSIVWP